MYMGCRFSASSSPDSVRSSTAKVVAFDGSLKEYSLPADASNVLDASSCFLCCSDMLFYDSRIPPMRPGDLLLPGQIYFLLPAAMLDRPLSISDMAALAVKASTALAALESKKGGRRRRKRVQAMPFTEDQDAFSSDEELRDFPTLNEDTAGIRIEKKMGKSPSMRRTRKLLSRPYGRRLSTIEEAPEGVPD